MRIEFRIKDARMEVIPSSRRLHYRALNRTLSSASPSANAMMFHSFALAQSQSKIFVLFSFLTLFAILFASLVQIRRSMVPIETLQMATLQVSKGDLGGRVVIDSYDEFQVLGGAFNHMIESLVENIEARKQNYNKLLKARNEAIAAAKTEVMFVQNVSHEFRTPLTSICSYSEILQTLGDEDGKTRDEFVGIIVSESQRLAKIVDGVIKLSTIQSETVTWNFEEVDLALSLRDAVDQAFPESAKNRIEIECNAADGLTTCVDIDRIKEVWHNLISNAVKFSTPYSSVQIRAFRESSEIVVEFEDHGRGIATEDQEIIFERFRQLGDLMCDKPSGTGLGLCIAKAIVEHHGGSISVESEPGCGSTFRVTLPSRTASELDGPWVEQQSIVAPTEDSVEVGG